MTSTYMNSDPAAPAGGMQRDFAREQKKMEGIGLNPLQMGSMDFPTFMEAVYTPEELSQISQYQDIKGKKQAADAASAKLDATPRTTTGGMRILENGLRKKGEIGNQALGESELFKAAGLSGYAVLSQSMAQRSNEIKQKYQSFSDELVNVSTGLKETFEAANFEYERLSERYNVEAERFQSVIDDLINHEQAIELIKEREKSDARLIKLRDEMSGDSSGSFGGKYNEDAAPSTGGSFENLVTGAGSISGMGSSLWGKGLDITGSKGSAIMSPFEGEVIGVDSDSGFGNRVKIRAKDGQEVWLSHLDAVNPDFYEGATVFRGDKIGTMGNTGNVLTKKNGEWVKPSAAEQKNSSAGVHVDITMPDGQGGYLTPQQVKKIISGVKSSDPSGGPGNTTLGSTRDKIGKLMTNSVQMGWLKDEFEGATDKEKKDTVKELLKLLKIEDTVNNVEKVVKAVESF